MSKGICSNGFIESLESRQLLAAALISDLNPKTGGSSPYGYGALGSQAVFMAGGESDSFALYRSSGPGSLIKIADLPVLASGASTHGSGRFASAGTRVWFTRSDELWVTDGQAAGTRKLVGGVDGTSLASDGIGKVYFRSNADGAGSTDHEPWVSDGTVAGTRRIADLVPGAAGSIPDRFFPGRNGEMFFIADAAASGYELWRTDGTAGGTRMLRDLLPGTTSSYPSDFVWSQTTQRLYFSALISAGRSQIFESDGTAGGTVGIAGTETTAEIGTLSAIGNRLYYDLVVSPKAPQLWKIDLGTRARTLIAEGPTTVGLAAGSLTGVYSLNGQDYFWHQNQRNATTGEYVSVLCRTNGTQAGTAPVVEQSIFSISSIVQAGDTLVFVRSSNGGYDREYWRTDGTALGTVKLGDVVTPSAYLKPLQIGVVGTTVFLGDYDSPLYGHETFALTNGSVTPQLTGDVETETGPSFPQHFRSGGRYVYFVTGFYSDPVGVWRTDGTEGGTVKVAEVPPGNTSSPYAEQWLTALVGDRFYFAIGGDVYVTNGTSQTTKKLADFRSADYVSQLVAADGGVYFAGRVESTNVVSLYRIDAATDEVRALSPLNETSWSRYSRQLIPFGTGVYFVHGAADGSDKELWYTNGTSNGTAEVVDLNTAAGGSSAPRGIVASAGRLFFAASDSEGVVRLYVMTPGLANAAAVPLDATLDVGYSLNNGQPVSGDIAIVGDVALFRATQGNVTTLWRSDGTAAGTYPLADQVYARQLTLLGNRAFFVADGQLWVSDGTRSGTIKLSTDLNTDLTPDLLYDAGGPRSLTPVGNRLFFVAARSDGSTGVELFVSDGTIAGTRPFIDLRSDGRGGAAADGWSAPPSSLARLGTSTVLFAGNTDAYGAEPWMAWDDPVPAISGIDATLTGGSSVSLSGSALLSPDAGVGARYDWDLDYDGITFSTDATGPSPVWSVPAVAVEAQRTIALRVHDGRGAAATVTRTVRVLPLPATSVTLQSELATLSGGTTKSTSHAGYTGTGYADYAGQNSAVTYSLTRGSAGSGKLEFLYANGSTANRPLQVLVNNVIVGTIACAPTGGWATWATVSLNNVALPAGSVAIKVVASTSAGGANVDSMTMTASDTVTPPPPPPTTGTDLALNKPTTASSTQASGNAAAKATDGSATTRWSSTYADNQWLQVDLGSANVISRVRLNWEAAYGKSYRIQGSNNASNWTDLYSTTTGDGGVDSITISNTTAWRYVRILALTRATKYGFSLFDFNVYGTGGTPPVNPPPATTGAVGGFLFFDSNKNAKFDTGEAYQAGKVVFIDLDGDNVLDSNEKKLTTDANGKFNFTGLAAGTYKVRRVVPSGYKVTTPVTNITITAGQIFSTVAIGTATV